jgi:hypothetical protein
LKLRCAQPQGVEKASLDADVNRALKAAFDTLDLRTVLSFSRIHLL